MSILPLDEGRYGSREMRAVFERSSRYRCYLEVEAALAESLGEHGVMPADAADRVARALRTLEPDLDRIEALERETHHEVAAVVRAAAEACGPDGRWVHFGATSSDIIDTTTALQLARAIRLLKDRLAALLAILAEAAHRHRDRLMIGRTHGQHALPTTLGFKIANWLDELGRHATRLMQLEARTRVGKMSGAVGTMAGFGPLGADIEGRTLAILGLGRGAISTQIVHRDRLAEFICFTAQIGSTLDGMATEVRNLQRNEIGELAEPFGDGAQMGSSTMPQKRNPVLCENICSLARLLRGLVGPALENMVQWHERDLASSGNERFTIPQSCILLDEMLIKALRVFGGLWVDTARMSANLAMSQGRIMAEAVLLRMVEAGADRTEAYRVLQRITHHEHFETLSTTLIADPTIARHLSRQQVEDALGFDQYVKHCGRRIDAVIASTRARIRQLAMERAAGDSLMGSD